MLNLICKPPNLLLTFICCNLTKLLFFLEQVLNLQVHEKLFKVLDEGIKDQVFKLLQIKY